MSFLNSYSLLRLVRDHREVLENPLPDVQASPQEDDLYIWHASVRSSEGCLGGAPIHALIVFPQDYPASHPEVRLFHKVPHPNVRGAMNNRAHGKAVPLQARWRLALWDCLPDTNTWSASYTVHSVLLQLQVFLLIEDMGEFAPGPEALAEVTASAHSFSCPHCPHAPGAPYPAFPTAEDIITISHCAKRAKKLVSKPCIPARKLPARTSQTTSVPTTPSKATPTAPPSAGPSSKQVQPAPVAGPSKALTPAAAAPQPKGEGCWVAVTHGKKAVKAGASHVGPAVVQTFACSTTNPFQALKNKSAVKKVQAAVQPSVTLLPGPSPAKATPVPASKVALAPHASTLPPSLPPAPTTPLLTKAAKKNLARKQKRQGAAPLTSDSSLLSLAPSSQATPPKAPAAAASTGSTAHPSPSVCSALTPATSSPAGSSSGAGAVAEVDADEWAEVPSKAKAKGQAEGAEGAGSGAGAGAGSTLQQKIARLSGRPHSELVREAVAQWREELQGGSGAGSGVRAEEDTEQREVLREGGQVTGLFGLLRRDELLGVLCLLQPSELAVLSSTCRGMRAMCRDGALWQALLQTHYPGTRLAASRMSDWRHTYVLEANNVLDDLKCFFTRASFKECVLCLPINYTVNPKTQAVDYIEAFPDLIALDAFTGGVRQTSRQEHFKAVLPLYITSEHFARAAPHYRRLLRELAPQLVQPGGALPPPSAWLEVLGKVLNTAVVLLCDRGHVASHRALLVFVAVHRLLLAMCDHHNLWAEVRQQLDTFLSSPARRTKAECPNLGLLLPLLSLSRQHSWQQVAVPLLEESMARGVMWMCKASPALESRFSAQRGQAGWEASDPELVQGSWEAARVSTRLMLFHHAFLCLVGSPPGSTLESVMDTADSLYGHPGAALGQRFLRAIHRIMKVSSWSEYFALLGMKGMTPEKITHALRTAWTRSCKAGYTRPGMDYSRIQASGVSKILLKGDTYSAPPTMTKMELVDLWSWKPSGGTKFLDASVLLYETWGRSRVFLEAVDYSHTRSQVTARPGAVLHSGDVMEEDSGKHTVQVNLPQLGARVTEMYVVVSAWAGAMLSDIVQPMVQVCEPRSGMALCEYHLEQQGAEVRRANSSVIMARVYQAEAGGQWRVQALGLVGEGCAGTYEPILRAIQAGQW